MIMSNAKNKRNYEELFLQLIVTEDYRIVLSKERLIEVELEPLVKVED